MASTSSNTLQWKHDVFLSFRGKDTRFGFISHLKKALLQNQIVAFIDDQLGGGENISPALLKKIEESNISLVIFSKNYADSSWCLEELEKILECKERLQQMVLPVFYQVDPTDIQELRGSFGDAIAKHRQELTADRVDNWSNALREIANLKGWDSRNFKSESKLIDEIVSDILKKLECIPISSYDFPGLVGIESRIKEVESLLCLGSTEVCIVGIWGMGGIGKTTIAGAVYDRISNQFDGRCFMPDVRKKLESRTRDDLIKEILCEVLEKDKLNTRGTITPRPIKNMLHKRKVLVVLDDLNRSHQEFLKQLVADLSYPGSRIIVTSRDKRVIENEDAKLYEVKGLNKEEACQLFSLHAFHRNYDPAEKHALLGSAVNYCKGSPLALRILGCNLYIKSTEVWKDELAKIEKIPDDEIQNVLRISYDGLDSNEKSIFLYIACFFKGWDKNLVERWLDACGCHAKSGIDRLIDKSLITISDEKSRISRLIDESLITIDDDDRMHDLLEQMGKDKVEMHDLLEQMGKDIVCEECRNDPEKRRILWDYTDIHYVLSGNKGTETIEAISPYTCESLVEVSRTAFERMSKLRLLSFKSFCVRIPESLDFLPNSLRVLSWVDYPLNSLPSNFSTNNLVELEMPNSRIEHLWGGVQPQLMNLKILNLHRSMCLINVDFPNAPNLEIINLSYCCCLVEVSSSIRNCGKLTSLNLSGCEKITKFPDVPWNIKELLLDGTAIEQVPSSVRHLSHLDQLSLAHTESLESLPSNIGQLKCLKKLDLSRCRKLASLPVSICSLSQLTKLQLSWCTSVESLPSNIGQLTCLERLDLFECTKLTSLPDSICRLSQLVDLQLRNCTRLESLPSGIGKLKSLKKLDIGGFTKITRLPDSICSLSQLTKLQLSGCTSLESLPSDIGQMKCVKKLDLRGFTKLTRLPDSICTLSQLTELQLSGCTSLESLPSGIGQLKCVKELDLHGFTKLTRLPDSICSLSQLTELQLSGCTSLESLPSNIGKLKCLKEFDLRGCTKLTRLPDSICSLSQLTELQLSGCTSLESLPSDIGELKYLKDFTLCGCSKLMSLPSSICNLESLLELCLHGCVNLNGLPNNLGNLKSVESLAICSSAWGCPGTHVHKEMELPGLNHLGYCGISEIPDSLGALVSLRRLCLSGTNIESIPATIKQLPKLVYLDLRDCERLQCLPELPSSLGELDASNCTSLRSVAGLDQFREGRGLIKFKFSNCFKLDQSKIMADAQLIFEDGVRELRVCIPGSEVPEWFSHKETRSSLRVKPHGKDCKILGWAFCAINRFDSSNGGTLCCQLLGKEEIEFSSFLWPQDVSYPMSEHVILWNTREYSGAFRKATFCYEPFGLIGNVKKVIKCGVHPIFGHHGNEVEEPHPKRLKMMENKDLISLLLLNNNQEDAEGNGDQEAETNDDWLSLSL